MKWIILACCVAVAFGAASRRAVECKVDADCTCPNHGEIASCNQHMCQCSHDHGGVGRRAVECHVDADCTCPNHGEIASCNQHMCQCSHDHGGGGRRAVECHVNADCTCPNHGEIASCNQHMCQCSHDHGGGGRRAVECKVDADCTCPNHGEIASCNQHMCQCSHDHGGVGKRETVACTNVTTCTTLCAPSIGECKHDKCHCHHEPPARRAACQTAVDCVNCPHGTIAECDAHHQCQCKHDNGNPVGKRETVACTNVTTCTTLCAPSIGECKHDKCHCHHEPPARRAACQTAVDCVNCPHGTIAECDAHHQCQCKHDNGNPVGKRQVMCHNNAECAAHCSPHIGTCNNNKCHCQQH
ncbi:uncharacterized protein LOC143062797 isoform X3 [Mytilus galloprovincialis]|uniref:uncharacterized protein LOC143062797 isoform X3 n=1 Tax=Mytilus galloprovincialis TaxID=29158 RepID=UPI003F7BC306